MKISISIFREFFASIDKIFIFGGRRSLGYNSMKFSDVPKISYFIKIVSLSAACEAARIYHVYY